MIRKLTVILLVLGLCLMGVIPVLAQKTYDTLDEYEKLTGNKIEKFNEAPMLKVKVAAGELPRVEERLPEEPLVVEPSDEIGQYGGVLTTPATGPAWGGGDDWQLRAQFLFRLCPDLRTIVPNIAKGWDWSDDLKTLTIYLRKGMKWSDGVSCTADDVMFWYEGVLLNDQLTPVKPKRWSPGGELVKVEKIDDYAVRFRFTVPYPVIVNIISVGAEIPLLPKHYLEQYHPKYNPKAGDIAKEEGFDEWWMCFNSHNLFVFGQAQQDIDRPNLYPWALKEIDSFGNKYFERNPYYWKIDTGGNQLPYIDRQDRIVVSSTDVIDLKTIAGEFTAAGQWLLMKNYTLYRKGEEKGNYRVMLWKGCSAALAEFSFNYAHKDPILRKIFNDIRFRQAMSLAINRDEINQTSFFGKAVPLNSTLAPETTFYEDWMGKYYVEYDPKRANDLLDEMGLKWDKDHKHRLRPDDETLAITIDTINAEEYPTISQLVKEYWEKVGVKTVVKIEEGSLFFTRKVAGEMDASCWGGSHSEFGAYQDAMEGMGPVHNEGATEAWKEWVRTEGKSGEEPPEEARRVYELLDEWQQTLTGTEKYMKLAKEALTIVVENLWNIGTVGLVPRPVIIKNGIGNTPEDGTWDWQYRRFLPYSGDQWFFKK